LDVVDDGMGIRAEMGDLIGRTSVPAIWIDQVFIGGCNDGPLGGIVSLDDKGELDSMLKAAGAM
jgi:glutaredoxin 3